MSNEITRCNDHYRAYWIDAVCEREQGHPGGHHNREQHHVWYRGGSSGISVDAVECPSCGTLSDKLEGPCRSCLIWQEYAKEYAAGELVSNGDELYRWSPGHREAFGGTKVIVRMNDGRVFGPDSCLWHKGHIDHEYREAFAKNAEIEWGVNDA